MRKVAAFTCTLLFFTLFGTLPAGAETTAATLKPSGTVGGFGTAVAVSTDKAIIGAPSSDAVVFFAKTSTGWTQRALISARDTVSGDEFGSSVAISGDTLVVGASADTERGLGFAGSARVFTWSGSSWSESAKLAPGDGAAKDLFGYAVAIAGDIAIIGAPFDDDQGTNTGSAYIYTRSGSTWTQSAKLRASEAVSGFGSSVAISGTTAVIGGSESAWVFTRSASGWSQQARLKAPDQAAYDFFGLSVGIDGDSAIVGSPFDDDRGLGSGSVYLFNRSGSSWYQQAKLNAGDAAKGDRFGWNVAMAGDAAIVGSPYDDEQRGSAYFIQNGSSGWAQSQKLLAPVPATGSRVGFTVGLGGGNAIAGAPPSSVAYAYPVSGSSSPPPPPPPPTPGVVRTTLTKADNGYVGALGKQYEFNFDVTNSQQQTATVTVQLAESGAYGNGDSSWGTKSVTMQVPPGQTAALTFAGAHTWQWTKNEPAIRGSVSDWLSTRTGCADLTSTLNGFGDVLTTADTTLKLADRTKLAFGLADPVHSYTYQRGSGTSANVSFDPIAVKLVPGPMRLDAVLHALGLGLGAKAWACAGWVPSGMSQELRDATLATSAAYKFYADRLYRAAWEASPAYATVPTPQKVEIARLAGVRGAVREHVDRLMSVASLQDARFQALIRYESAVNAGQYLSAVRQLEAAQRWTDSINDSILSIEGLTQSLAADVPATMTRQQHLDFASWVNSNGLPGQLSGFLRDLGYSSADVTELQRSWAIAPSSPSDGALRASLTAVFALQRSAEASLQDLLGRALTEAYGLLGQPDSKLELTGSGAENGWFRTAPQAKITGVGPGGGAVTLEYRVGSGAWKPYSAPFQVEGTGLQELFTRAKMGSLVQDPPRAWRVRIDAIAPVTTAANVPASWVNGPIVVELSAADASSGPWTTSWSVQHVSGGPAAAVGSGRFVPVRNEGQWKVNYSSKDVAGNQEQWRNVTVRLDLTSPQSDITDSINKNFVGQVSLSGPVSDPMSGIRRVELVFQRIDTFSGSPTGGVFYRTASNDSDSWSFNGAIDSGKYWVWPSATDVAGNVELNPASDWIEIVVV